MTYIYKNEAGRPINIGGYQFQKDGELPSNIIIDRFKEAVSNGFLRLREIKDEDKLKNPPVLTPEEEARKAAEAEVARKAEESRLATEAEQARLAEEAAKAEEARKAEEATKQAEEARLAEEAKKAEETRIAEEEARKAAEQEKRNSKIK